MRSQNATFASIAILACLSASGPAAAKEEGKDLYQNLQPYRAVYELRQAARPGTSLNLQSASATVEARIGCKDVEYMSTMSLNFVGRGGHTVTRTVELKTKESHDGRTLRFSSRLNEDGRDIRRHESQAALETSDGPGEGVVTRGAPERTKLQRGTVLPGTHFVRSLAAAAAGKTETKHRVYAGEDEIRLADITSTVVGTGTAPASATLGDFAGKPGWTIREVVHGVGERSPARITESFITADGVTTSMKMMLQGIELVGKAVKIEKLPKPSCP
jgi:hypothetical protein